MQMRVKAASSKTFISRNHLYLQSAMEYLMTYGWAILIIAVVLGALFSLGVFNTSNLAPKAQPGSCRVFRPSGTGTSTFVNLEGVCTNELPQYVTQFNGGSSLITISASSSLNNPSTFTVSAWLAPSSIPTTYMAAIVERTACGSSWNWQLYTTNNDIGTRGVSFSLYNPWAEAIGGTPLTANQWVFVTGTYDGSNVKIYVNGVLGATTPATGYGSISTPTAIGTDTCGNAFRGSISNVQIYNASLDAGEVQSLYAEGIGGAPQALNNLIGWWPLNGNVTDYSGNNRNGAPTSVTYSSSWITGYQGH
jgi:Concanavalin A-like lectin/glucanases superfamily